MGLYESAGTPGPGFYAIGSATEGSILHLISLVGTTFTVNGAPGFRGTSGSLYAPGMYSNVYKQPQIALEGNRWYVGDGSGLGAASFYADLVAGGWLVRAVPEPPQVALVALGFGLVGVVFRRAKRI